MTAVSSLIAEIRDLLSEPTNLNPGKPVFFQDASIISYINRAIDDLCIETDVNYRVYEYSVLAAADEYTFVALTGSVESDLLDLTWLDYYSVDDATDNWNSLLRVNPRDNKNVSTGDTGVLLNCIIYDDTIYLNRDTAIGDKFLIGGRWKKTTLTATSDTFPLDAMSEDAVIKFATSMGNYKQHNDSLGDKWLLLYEARKKQIQTKMGKLVAAKDPMTIAIHKTSSSINRNKSQLGRTINV